VVVLASAERCSAGSAADVCVAPEDPVALLQTRMLRRAPGDLDHEDADEDADPSVVQVDADQPSVLAEAPAAVAPPTVAPPTGALPTVALPTVALPTVALPTVAPATALLSAASRAAGTAPPASVVHVVLPPRNATLSLAEAAEPAAPPAATPPAPATQAAAVEQQLDPGPRTLQRGECLQPCVNGICHDGECFCRYPYAGRVCTSKENLRVEMWAACSVFMLIFLLTAGVVVYVYVPQSDLDRAPQVEQDNMADEEWKPPAKHHG